MIPLSPRALLLVLLFAPLAALFLAAAWYYARRVLSQRTAGGAEANFYRCRACGHVYLDYGAPAPKACGKCGCVNESIRGLS